MQINSTNTNPMASKSSPQNNKAEEKQIDSEIQSLEKEKAEINKQIYNIKGDFAPPKPKEELIRPLKDKIKLIDAKIQQKQAEKMEKQADNLKEASNSTEGKKANSIKKNEGNNLDCTEDKNKSIIEKLSDFTTQTGIINEKKVKNSLKDSDKLLIKEASLGISNTSDYSNPINNKKINDRMKNAIDAYNLAENGEPINLTTHGIA